MLVRVFRVVRPEQVGELRTGVLDKVADGLQAGEDNKIPRVKHFPEAPRGAVRVDEDGHGRFTLRSLDIPGICRRRGTAAGNHTETGRCKFNILLYCNLAYSATKRKFAAVERLCVSGPALHAAEPGQAEKNLVIPPVAGPLRRKALMQQLHLPPGGFRGQR